MGFFESRALAKKQVASAAARYPGKGGGTATFYTRATACARNGHSTAAGVADKNDIRTINDIQRLDKSIGRRRVNNNSAIKAADYHVVGRCGYSSGGPTGDIIPVIAVGAYPGSGNAVGIQGDEQQSAKKQRVRFRHGNSFGDEMD